MLKHANYKIKLTFKNGVSKINIRILFPKTAKAICNLQAQNMGTQAVGWQKVTNTYDDNSADNLVKN